MDLKAEHFERQVHTLEQERDQWEKKHEVRQINQRSFSPYTLLYTGGPREVPGLQEGARRARRQHGRAVIVLRSLFSHLYVRHRACDKFRVSLTLSIAAWLTYYIRPTLATLTTIQFVYVLNDLFSESINNVQLHETTCTVCLLSVEFK